jgi:integrase/recombinase XerD
MGRCSSDVLGGAIVTSPFDVRVSGPLVPWRSGFFEELDRQGYTPLSMGNQVRLLAHLSRWMAEVEVGLEALSEEWCAEFLRVRRAAGYTSFLSARALVPLLSFLRGVGVVPEPVVLAVEGPLAELLAGYRVYLVEERALAAATVGRYGVTAAWFLGVCGWSSAGVGAVTAERVHTFVLAECPVRSVGLAKNIVAALRSLLRFLFLTGRASADFSVVVPAVAGWRGAALPKALPVAVVARLLAGCDVVTVVGRRDRAVLVLLSRLGLRAGEVAGLMLDDVDWGSGEVTIRGKGSCLEQLPIPVDVGEAIVAYLTDGRPLSMERVLFLGVRAPNRAMTAGAIKAIVRQACRRAGIPPFGAHRLRHTVATVLLGAGAGLSEVGQLLRHRSADTTAIYAKVDINALSTLAQPWPQARS